MHIGKKALYSMLILLFCVIFEAHFNNDKLRFLTQFIKLIKRQHVYTGRK